MAGSEDLIDFNVIESHKENIQALPSGRSAKALAQLYSPPLLGVQPPPSQIEDEHTKARQVYEKELQAIDEADDPLDVYDRYVKWTMDAYPSAQATPQSQLLPLLERATKTFQTSAHYRNDPRYLKLWLHYIRLFSDAPREVFVFLERHSIGESLALYYEEFAAWLENAGRWNQAEEIYKLGLEREARPVERLLRKFGEFEQRKQARPDDVEEPSSPALPAVRPALAAKIDPFAAASPSDPQQQRGAAAAKKSKSAKMAIFADNDDSSRPSSGNSSKGWDNIGSLADRRKENTVEARPWAGEKLKTGKTNGGMQKMMIFKDEKSHLVPNHIHESISGGNHEHQCVPNPKTGRLECVFVDLEAVYPRNKRDAPEYCFEELRAKHRGWRNQDWSKAPWPKSASIAPPHIESEMDIVMEEPKQKSKAKQRGFKIFEDASAEPSLDTRPSRENEVLVENFSKSLALNDHDENSPPVDEAAILAKKARKEERANRTRKIQVMDVKHIKNETKTIQLNLDSPTRPKVKRKRSGDRAEPTMTINTKEAMDEIYGIFNQPLASQTEQEDVDSEESEDDYTTDGESTGTGKLSGPPSEYGDETRNDLMKSQMSGPEDDARSENTGWSDFTTNKHVPKESEEDMEEGELVDENPRTRYVPVPPEDFEPPTGQYRDMAVIANNRLPFMTPIVEQTESSLGTETGKRGERDYFSSKTPSRKTGKAEPIATDDDLCSSPFQEEFIDLKEDKKRVLQPIRTKSTKGTISLGAGSAKSQIAAKTTASVPAAAEAVQKGPIIHDEQCNPMDPHIRHTILSEMRPSLSTYEGYAAHADESSGKTAEIRKWIKTVAKAKSGQDKAAMSFAAPPTVSLGDSDTTYTIKRELGAGTFAPVYLAENSAISKLEAEQEEGEEQAASWRVGKHAYRKALEAIKMEEPPSTWEFYIIRQSHRRLGVSRATESIVRAHEMHLYRDECFLVEEYRDQGTLLDLVNIARLDSSNGGGMDEVLAMFFTVELLRTTEALHAKQLIHGDLKGDNVLVRLDDPGMETDWSPTYFPSGAHGWTSKGVCLIDFGRGIDMKQFMPNVGFIADWKTSEADCTEMRELRPWTYQIDYHGLAGIVHSMLFGKYMETIGEKGGLGLGQGATKTYRIRESLKRYWQTEIWGDLFALLLNPLAHLEGEEGRKMPVLRSMKQVRERMEGWLEENCERGMGLKGMILKMEGAIRERKRRSVR